MSKAKSGKKTKSNAARFTCPRCGSRRMKYPALSRADNFSDVCSLCGHEEAMGQVKGDHSATASLWSPRRLEKSWQAYCQTVAPGCSEVPSGREQKRLAAQLKAIQVGGEVASNG